MRLATIMDKQRIVDIISKSFDQNNSVNYVVKQDKKRKKRLRLLIEYSIYQGMEFGKVFISKDQNAACILLFPFKKKTTWSSAIWDAKLVLMVIGIQRVNAVMKREKLLKKNHPKESFYHLWYIGVDPEYQNKGTGSELLDKVLESYNDKPVYLETSVVSNLRWYQRFGFEIIETIDLGYNLYVLKKSN
ncbi:N-acetyltransferase [Aquimarina sp. I32.4]|uniref:GNAT family N-acetyltransferase n=1 Tax=Aquimarina sp. I32.4 TaxID=2053903 RepID=UPI000CDE6344|nr:GNAT family N-acetyltransferase [Aquimarina sp. I32.4]